MKPDSQLFNANTEHSSIQELKLQFDKRAEHSNDDAIGELLRPMRLPELETLVLRERELSSDNVLYTLSPRPALDGILAVNTVGSISPATSTLVLIDFCFR